MRLTKLGHACTRFDKDGAVLVIDPGAFSDPQAMAGANAVLITPGRAKTRVPAGASTRSPSSSNVARPVCTR